jgi:Family of unknown function (DUF6178)
MLSRETLHHRPSSRKLLARVLETPELGAQIQSLPGPVLGKLIDHVGLEDAGELVALATTEQLSQIFDEDLWQSAQPGEDERFDAERFLLWLEVMLEAGDRFVAARLADLPQELVTLAFHRHLLVVSLDDLQSALCAGDDEAEAAEKAFESCLSEEIDDYQLIWRGGDGWDNVLAALLALDRDHHSLVVDLLERCAHLSSEYIDDNGGLYEVLSSEDMLEADLAAERETRRAERGHVAPSAALAFLRLARQPGATDTSLSERDPLTRAYFRELSRAPAAAPPRPETPSKRRDLARLLEASGIVKEDAPRLLLGADKGKHESAKPLVVVALRRLAVEAPEKFTERSEELAYLSNVLVAGSAPEGRRLRPLEAVEHAMACVSLGLALVCGSRTPSADEAALELGKHPCDGLLRLAFTRARGPSLAAGPLIDAKTLAKVRSVLGSIK